MEFFVGKAKSWTDQTQRMSNIKERGNIQQVLRKINNKIHVWKYWITEV